MVEKACRNCHLVSERSVCPNCRSTDLSDDFTGLVIVLDPKNSHIAKSMGIEEKGRYAIRIR